MRDENREKRTEKIHDALNFLDEEMIEEVEKLRGFVEKEELKQDAEQQTISNRTALQKKKSWHKWTALAASICVFLTGSWIYGNYVKPLNHTQDAQGILWDAILNPKNTDKENADMQGADGENVDMQDVDMEDADMQNANRQDADMEDTDIQDADMQNTDIENKDTQNTNAEDSNIKVGDIENMVTSNSEANGKETPRAESDHVQENTVPKNEQTDDVSESMPESEEAQNEGVTIPQMKVNLRKAKDNEIQEDMLGFFILNGNCYIQYEFQTDYKKSGADFVGKRVGHITGMIDEWTSRDGYVEGAGSYTGDVYEIKGIDPELMLCMVWEDGTVETFLHNNGITLYKGTDLVDGWLNLRGNFDRLSFETVANGQFTHRQVLLSKEEKDICDRFLTAFAEGGFVYVEDKISHPFGGDIDTEDMLEFYFVKENGVRLRFRTMGDGYVCFPWIDACVQIDMDTYNEMVDFLLKYM